MNDKEKLTELLNNNVYLQPSSIADYLINNNVIVQEKGKWILEREPDGKPYCFHCSVCDGDFHYIGIKTAFPYCPNCGARMDDE